MRIRVGIEGGRQTCLARAAALGAPILVSANSLWSHRRQRFEGLNAYRAHDVALDSGGFVAMKRYGGYRYNAGQYARLAADLAPSWWAQMDYCCEPEIAGTRAEVFRRIDRTVEGLHACQSAAREAGAPAPMPVLQGWHPTDYCSGPAFEPGFAWPSLVGLGSVCRRNVSGPAGIMAILAALDPKLPPHVRLHLFGVKSSALPPLLEHYSHRLASVDSMAWNMAARWDAIHAGRKCTAADRADALEAWYGRQLAHLEPSPQLRLPL